MKYVGKKYVGTGLGTRVCGLMHLCQGGQAAEAMLRHPQRSWRRPHAAAAARPLDRLDVQPGRHAREARALCTLMQTRSSELGTDQAIC